MHFACFPIFLSSACFSSFFFRINSPKHSSFYKEYYHYVIQPTNYHHFYRSPKSWSSSSLSSSPSISNGIITLNSVSFGIYSGSPCEQGNIPYPYRINRKNWRCENIFKQDTTSGNKNTWRKLKTKLLEILSKHIYTKFKCASYRNSYMHTHITKWNFSTFYVRVMLMHTTGCFKFILIKCS